MAAFGADCLTAREALPVLEAFNILEDDLMSFRGVWN
jgi:hypothetical protein